MYYYAGLPSNPVLVARTGSIPYKAPTGPEAYSRLKELGIVGNHDIQDAREDGLASKVHAILGGKGVDWTTTDVVRISYVEDASLSSVVLWIGVKPGSLSYNDGIDVALRCKELLLDYSIDDVHVEIRESELIRFGSGPKLLDPAFESDPTVDVRRPFTPTLGIPVCSQFAPWAEGTAGFFLNEGGAARGFCSSPLAMSYSPSTKRTTTSSSTCRGQPTPP